MLDVFGGPGFLAKATNHPGLSSYVLDTKFGPIYDVTKPPLDVSYGKCVAGMISPPRQHTWCSPKVFFASAAIANLLHRARMHWILEHLCDRSLWDVPKIQTLAAQPRTGWALTDFCDFGSPCRKRTWFLVEKVDKWLTQLALVAYFTQALIVRTGLPMYSTLATHDGHCLKKMMTASCTLIISAEQHERLLATDVV